MNNIEIFETVMNKVKVLNNINDISYMKMKNDPDPFGVRIEFNEVKGTVGKSNLKRKYENQISKILNELPELKNKINYRINISQAGDYENDWLCGIVIIEIKEK